MKLVIGTLPVGSHTTDERLLDQLEELSVKLDEESEILLNAVTASGNEDDAGASGENERKPFGVVYARDLDAGKAVGYLKYVPMGSVCRIESLYVDKEYRRKCIGYSMMKSFYCICRENSAAKINLGCIAGNKEGNAFYESEGYRISDASYVLCRTEDAKNAGLPMQERCFNEKDWNRIWNEMAAYLDKEVNLPEELEMLRTYYASSSSYRPLSICSFEDFECAVFSHSRDAELLVPAFNVDPSRLDKRLLNGIAASLLRYAEEKGCKQVCISDIHLPSTLSETSSCWKRVGYTYYRMASDLRPKKSNLKI